MLSITGGTTAANGTALALNNLELYHTMVVTNTAGTSLTAGVVTLQGSIDGLNWFAMPNGATGALSLAAGASTAIFVGPAAVNQIRGAITTNVTGGTVNVSIVSQYPT